MRKALLLTLLLAAAMAHAQVPIPPVYISGPMGPSGVYPTLNSGTLEFASDADRSMTYPEMSAYFVKVTSGVSLTATRKLIAPLAGGFAFAIENATTGGQAIEVIGASGTGVTIANGATVAVWCDGTNYVAEPYVLAPIPNADLEYNSITVGGTACGLGSSCTPSTTVGGAACALGSTCAPSTTINGTGCTLGSSCAPPSSGTTTINGTACPLNGSCTISGSGYSLGNAVTTANFTPGAAAGSLASITAAAGLDGSHTITITLGSSPSTGILWTGTFTSSRGHNAYCTIQFLGAGEYAYQDLTAVSATSYRVYGDVSAFTSGSTVSYNVSCP